MSKNKSITIINNDTNEQFDFDIVEGTRGPKIADISSFYAKTGMFLYDQGFTSTANCTSEITFIDGSKGELRYRGHRIEDLVKNHNFMDVAFLLLNGELPTEEEAEMFDYSIKDKYYLHEGFTPIFNAFPSNFHPMAAMSSAVAALCSFYEGQLDMKSETEFTSMYSRVIAKMPTIAALAYRHSVGLPPVYPSVDKYFTENFLYMMRAYPDGHLREPIKEIEIKALDTIFSLHADHEQNASTTAVKTVCSTGAHPYVAISAGISALWGRAHGGANESVILQLQSIGSVDKVDDFIKRVKDPSNPTRLMGFGHRVYKSFDPRATILRELREKLRQEIPINSELVKIADKIENIALNDEYFIKRNLYPNIDFYSGTILNALGIPQAMFTSIFVIGRTVGWIAQWIEAKKQNGKITRPRQLYLGK